MISVLFAARNSVYKTIPGLDVWDEDRNALCWPGGNPGIFHPPCRLWSKWLRHFSSAPQEEKFYAFWSVDQVRHYGGVLEHPACSMLWDEAQLPKPGSKDKYGLSIAVYQQWFGHKAQKATWLYICGTNKLPEIPFCLGEPEVTGAFGPMSPRERAATPLTFAKWLVEVANDCYSIK